jgi:hypothetical protein
MKKRLFILVEGEDDVRFFGRIIKPYFKGSYDSVEIVPYASIKRDKVNRFLKSIRLMKNDYIFVSDIDSEYSVRDKKQVLYYRYSEVDGGSIIVVIKEIESWYLAGLDESASRIMGVPPSSSTDEVTKEMFNDMIPKHFISRIDFMFEILKHFSLPVAAERNRSFSYFIHRYHIDWERTFGEKK